MKTAGWGGLVGDAAELIAEIIAKGGTNPEAIKKMLAKELSGRQLVEDVGKFTSLVKEKGVPGAIAHGAKGVADMAVRRSHPSRALGGLTLGYTLPYTALATKERWEDPNAGPIQRALGAGGELLLNPLSAHPGIGFTTSALMNVGGPAVLSQIGRGADKLFGLQPKVSCERGGLLFALAKVALLRKMTENPST